MQVFLSAVFTGYKYLRCYKGTSHQLFVVAPERSLFELKSLKVDIILRTLKESEMNLLTNREFLCRILVLNSFALGFGLWKCLFGDHRPYLYHIFPNRTVMCLDPFSGHSDSEPFGN